MTRWPIVRSPDLFHFLVRRVLPATGAELLLLDSIRGRLAVLHRRIIPLFAIAALQRNNFSGHTKQLLTLCSAGTLARAAFSSAACGADWSVRAAPCYCTISAIVPAPTVWPPSRIANRRPFSIATGVISSITRLTLSPGITISVPAGNSATPVTSVVRR